MNHTPKTEGEFTVTTTLDNARTDAQHVGGSVPMSHTPTPDFDLIATLKGTDGRMYIASARSGETNGEIMSRAESFYGVKMFNVLCLHSTRTEYGIPVMPAQSALSGEGR